ncbi:MAG: hypothetical protein C5B53_05725 [Candidatus Melainabacteria bacterium]|nr:MAG: hypothetical protein C5B53_05725 [Candidatus Melainabacteria bacterium]
MTLRILLAGQNQKNTDLVRQALKQLDVDIIRAPGMSLSLFLAKKNQPHLIIADLELLDGDGLLLMAEMSRDPQLKSMPFIFLLPKKPASTLEKSLLAGGARNILCNTSEPKELLNIIGKLIETDQLPLSRCENETTE